MRKARVRAGWALAAAIALGIAAHASAQNPRDLGMEEPAPFYPERMADAVVPVSGSSIRLAEMKVELAWLSNPGTFSYPLAVRAVGASLEVGGQVPNQAIRQLALQLAREQAGVPVVDKLVIQPRPALPPVRASSEILCRAAATAVESFAGRIQEFEVKADSGGQLLVSGIVPSYEDKLIVSRRLSQVPGCSSVNNQLMVQRPPSAGEPYAQVRDDGRPMAPAENPMAVQRLSAPSPLPPSVVSPGYPGRSSTGFILMPDAEGAPSGTDPARAYPIRSTGRHADGATHDQVPEILAPSADDAAFPPDGIPAGPAYLQVQSRLERQIAKACGSAARGVEVVVQPNLSVYILVKVKSAAEGARLAAKVLEMLDFWPHPVSLGVQVTS